MESHKAARQLDVVAELPQVIHHLIFTLVYGERCNNNKQKCRWKITTFRLCDVCQKANCCERCTLVQGSNGRFMGRNFMEEGIICLGCQKECAKMIYMSTSLGSI